jgi:hypothetical protein
VAADTPVTAASSAGAAPAAGPSRRTRFAGWARTPIGVGVLVAALMLALVTVPVGLAAFAAGHHGPGDRGGYARDGDPGARGGWHHRGDRQHPGEGPRGDGPGRSWQPDQGPGDPGERRWYPRNPAEDAVPVPSPSTSASG